MSAFIKYASFGFKLIVLIVLINFTGAPLSMEEKVKLTLDKEHICHSNTHFVTNPFDESRNREAVRQAAQLQSNTREGHVDVDGKEIKPTTAPNINGYSFMATPSPAPGVTESPLMTWGEIEGTPFRLDGSDTPLPSSMAGTSFHLQQVSERDRIGLKLAEKVGKGYRDRKGRARPGNRPVASPYSTSVGTIRYSRFQLSLIILVFNATFTGLKTD